MHGGSSGPGRFSDVSAALGRALIEIPEKGEHGKDTIDRRIGSGGSFEAGASRGKSRQRRSGRVADRTQVVSALEKEHGVGVSDRPADRSSHDPIICLLYTSPSPRDRTRSRMPSSA